MSSEYRPEPAVVMPPQPTPLLRCSDRDIIDAYLYLLGRLLVLRQEHLDLLSGVPWNRLVERELGTEQYSNLDVACSEAWVAVDETSCTLVDVPQITGRYYTVQVLNPWGETLANIRDAIQECLAVRDRTTRPGAMPPASKRW